MTEDPAVHSVPAAVADAPPVSVPTTKPAAGLQLLGGDELIHLSLRPSPWCIAVYSVKPVLALVLAGAFVALAATGRPTLVHSVALIVLALAAFSSVVAATLHWACQIYVLTNRRVLRFRGVFNVDVAECALSQIGEVRLRRAWYEPALRLASICMTPVSSAKPNDEKPAMIWEHVARPDEVHEILVRAIQRSKLGT